MSVERELIERHKAEIPEWGHLPAAMRFKQALVKASGVERAFEVCSTEVGVPGLDRLRFRKRCSLLDAARSRAISFRELWPGGEPFTHQAPKVIGHGNEAPMHGHNRTAYLACLADALVRGRSAVVFSGDDALIDFERDEYSLPDNPEYDPGILHAERDGYWTMEPERCEIEAEEAFMLNGSHTIDFGHWVTEYLPKLMIALRAGLPEDTAILVDEVMPATHRQALQLLAPHAPVIVVPHLAPVAVRRLWLAPNPMYMGFYPTQFDFRLWSHVAAEAKRFSLLLGEMVRRAGGALAQDTGMRRIFLARKPTLRKKRLVNHAAIEELARARGFSIIYPEAFSFTDQMRLARHAEAIIAPDGSNSFVAWFARAGTKACTLSPSYTFPLADPSAVLAQLGIDHTIIAGTDRSSDELCAFWNDYEIDTGVFAAFLDRWIA